jgi:hypothetical protein
LARGEESGVVARQGASAPADRVRLSSIESV